MLSQHDALPVYQGIERIVDVLYRTRASTFHRKMPYGHFGQLIPDGAEFRNRQTELYPFVGVVNGLTDHPPGGANGSRAELDAAHVEDVDRNLEPVLALREHVFYRHEAVVEEQLTCR